MTSDIKKKPQKPVATKCLWKSDVLRGYLCCMRDVLISFLKCDWCLVKSFTGSVH